MEDYKEILQYLLDKEYMMIVGGKPVLTRKLLELEGKSSKLKVADYKETWNKFIVDAEIPHRVESPDGRQYTVRQYSPSNAAKLTRIIHDPKVNYEILVASTKNYYKTISYKSILSNYLEKDIWRGEYENWSNKNTTQPGENRWEN